MLGRAFEFSKIGRLVFLLCCLALAYSRVHGKIPLNELKCGVCQAVYHEVETSIANTKQTHLVQTRFRVDEKKRVPYARTEFRLMEIFEEDISPRLQHYGVKGKTGEREVVKKPDPTPIPTPSPSPSPSAAPTDADANPDDATAAPPVISEQQSADSQATPSPTALTKDSEQEKKGSVEVEGEAEVDKKEEPPKSKKVKSKSKDGIQHSPGIVKSLRAIYSEWLSDYEDEMVSLFRESRADTLHRLCVDLLAACKQVPSPQAAPASSPKEEL